MENKDTLSRREAVRFLAMVPVALYKLSAFGASSSHPVEDILIKCAAGITACEQLGKGLAEDITIAFSSLSAYLPTLTAIVKESSAHRKEAARQVAQCLFLKATLSLHKEGPKRAAMYMEQAARFGKESQDLPLQLGILKRLAWIYACDKQRNLALEKVLEAQHLLKKAKTPVSPLVKCRLLCGVAKFQALNGRDDDAFVALSDAHNAYPGDKKNDSHADYRADYNFSTLMMDDGLTYYHAGQYTQAFASFSQVIDPDTLLSKTEPSSERVRCEIINYATLASLKLPQKDMPRSINLWKTGIQSAIALQSEQRFAEAMSAYDIMEAVWTGERRITELRPLIQHW
jgi:tetratricopeptide (TPR) repeat protein